MIGAENWCLIGVLGMLALVALDVVRRRTLKAEREAAAVSAEEE